MTKRNVGRPPKNERADHCCMVRFTDTEFASFLTLFEQSRLQNRAAFIKARVFVVQTEVCVTKTHLAVTLQRQRTVAPKKINNNIFFMI